MTVRDELTERAAIIAESHPGIWAYAEVAKRYTHPTGVRGEE